MESKSKKANTGVGNGSNRSRTAELNMKDLQNNQKVHRRFSKPYNAHIHKDYAALAAPCSCRSYLERLMYTHRRVGAKRYCSYFRVSPPEISVQPPKHAW